MDYYDLIPSYLNDKLSQKQRQEFEFAVSQDAELRQAVEDHDVAEIILDAIIEDDFSTMIANSTEDANAGGATKSAVIWKILGASAAIGLLMWAFTHLIDGEVEDTRSSQYNFVAAVKPSARNTDDRSAIQAAFSRYNLDTVGTIEALAKVGNLESEYWLAEVAADRSRWAEVPALLPVIDSLSTVKRDRAVYILAYAYAYTNQPDKLDSLVERYENTIDPYYLSKLPSAAEE